MLLTKARNTSPVNLAHRSESATSASGNPPRMTAAGSFAVAVERKRTERTLPDSRSTWFRTMRRNRPPSPAARRSGPPRSSRRRAAMAEARCEGPRAVRGGAAPATPAGLARASAEVPPNGASWHSRKTCARGPDAQAARLALPPRWRRRQWPRQPESARNGWGAAPVSELAMRKLRSRGAGARAHPPAAPHLRRFRTRNHVFRCLGCSRPSGCMEAKAVTRTDGRDDGRAAAS